MMAGAAAAVAGGLVIDKLTTLFVYILLAVMWNLLAGYAGLVSVGQQAFFGIGGYFALRLVDTGVAPYPALVVGAIRRRTPRACRFRFFALRLKGGEFAIAMWVIAEAVRILVMFDPMVQGETGTSLLALNEYDPEMRRNLTYWLALASMAVDAERRPAAACAAGSARPRRRSAMTRKPPVPSASMSCASSRVIFVAGGVRLRAWRALCGLPARSRFCRAPISASSGPSSCCSWCWSAACAPMRARFSER